MGILNYSTDVPCAQTVTEIVTLLGRHQVNTAVRYRGPDPCGLDLECETPGGLVCFGLDVQVDSIHARLTEDYRAGIISHTRSTRDQAERCGWRILRDWLRAQLAFVESGQADLVQVFLPFLRVGSRTVYEAFQERYPQIASPA